MIAFLVILSLNIPGKSSKKSNETIRWFPEAQVDPDEYRLGPGDSIRVMISGGFQYAGDFSVDMSGSVALYGYGLGLFGASQSTKNPLEMAMGKPSEYTLLGTKHLGGLTLRQAEDTLQEFYSYYYKDVKVDLLLLVPRTVSVTVMGQVANRGVYECGAVERITDAITKAGGAIGRADLGRIRLIIGKDTSLVNLYDYIIKGDKSSNPFVDNDMTVFVPETEKTVVVSGAVGLAPVYFNDSANAEAVQTLEASRRVEVAWEEGDDVSAVVAKAGGLMPGANISAIRVIRGGVRLAASPETPVEPGDMVQIPKTPNEVYVMGEVMRPGAFQFSPGTKYIEYVSLAGPLERGYTKKFTVVKPDGRRVSVKPQDEAKPGDRVIVERVAFLWYEDYLRVLAAVTTILVTWLTLKR